MFRFSALLALLFPIALNAQESGGGSARVRFLAERVPQDLGQVVMAAEKLKSEPFTLPSNNLSEPLAAPARSFSLRTSTKDTALASIALPEGKSFVVLLIPASTGGYKPVVIASGDSSFRPGDVYFYNHADKTVLGYVGTSKFILPPAKSQILHPQGARPENFYDVGFGVREKEGDRTLSKTRWPVEERVRSYVFFFVDPATKRIDFRAVDETVPLEKPSQP